MTNYLLILLSVLLFMQSPLSAETAKKKKKKPTKAKSIAIPTSKKVAGEYAFVKGMGHLMLDEYDKAIEKFKLAQSVDPANAGIYFKLGDAYFKKGVKGEAITNLKKAVDLDGSNKAYYFLLSEVYKSELRFEDAAVTYEQMLKNTDDTKEFHWDLAKLYFYLGIKDKDEKGKMKINPHFLEKALDNYDEAEKEVGINKEIIGDKQKIYLQLNKPEKAIAEGEKLAKENPEDVVYRIRLAELKYGNGKKEEAITDLENVVKEQSANAGHARLYLFEYYLQDKKQEQAFEHIDGAFTDKALPSAIKVKVLEQYFYPKFQEEAYKQKAQFLAEKLVETHGEEAMAQAVKGDIFSLNGEVEKARNQYLKAIEIDPSKYAVWEQLVRLDMDLQETDSTIAHATKALELFPNQPIFWLYKGIAYTTQQKHEEAVGALEQGRKMTLGNKDLQAYFNAQLGDAYNSLEKYSKADDSYDKALEVNPDNVHVLNNYSYYLSIRGEKLNKALIMSERVHALEPGEPTYLDTYGWVLYVMKKYTEAEIYLRKAVVDSENGTVLEHYGDVLYQLGKTDQAVIYWKKAEKFDGVSDFLANKIKDKKLYE
ncbi:MAG: tetratricopeptide repeat protein [Cyclobacteriaceae bacterium]